MFNFINTFYYNLKPYIPRRLQISLRRGIIKFKLPFNRNVWPIDEKSSVAPVGWKGWPNGKKFALILTHDVDTQKGHDKCRELLNIEKSLNFKSSFNFVLEDYIVSPELRQYITDNGFEVGVHGLNHNGKLYKSKEFFMKSASKINHYLKEWGAAGFRSPSMQHNLEWIHNLDIAYDASTFDTDPFEPQSDGVGTIFPFYVKDDLTQRGYVEMPYTLPQDFTLYILMKENKIDIWKKKLNWIAENGGMALLNTHPDYINFENKNMSLEEFPQQYYVEFLEYIKNTYAGQYWHVLPREMAHFWHHMNGLA